MWWYDWLQGLAAGQGHTGTAIHPADGGRGARIQLVLLAGLSHTSPAICNAAWLCSITHWNGGYPRDRPGKTHKVLAELRKPIRPSFASASSR